MGHEEKGSFCEGMASLFSPPDREMIMEMREGRLLPFLNTFLMNQTKKDFFIKELILKGEPEQILEDLRSEYYRLFEEGGNGKSPLVESFYKPWTEDPFCPLPFAKERGYVMGDPALHLLALYQHCGLEVSDPFQGTPDHLVIELEFLSFLYRHAGDREIKKVIEDHFDWISQLRDSCQKAQAHSFYITLIDLLELFITSEKERLEREEHGKKEIHPEGF